MSLRRPLNYFLNPVDRETVLSSLPDGNALVVSSGGQKGSIGGVADNIGVFVCLAESIFDAEVVIVGVKGTSIVDDFPYFDASFGPLALLVQELPVVGASRRQLIREGMEVDRQDPVFQPVPPDVRRIDAHKLAVDYIIVQRASPGSLPSLTKQILTHPTTTKINHQKDLLSTQFPPTMPAP